MSRLRVHVVDPPAYTPPYDHALCAALARAGADVTLVTAPFAHGDVPPPAGYRVVERFYRRAGGPAPLRRAARLAWHAPGMLGYARRATREADIIHFQWLSVQQVDAFLLPRRRPLVLTAHDVIPREPKPGQRSGQKRLYERMDAVIVHSDHGARRLRDELGVDPARVHVIPHGPLEDLIDQSADAELPEELAAEPAHAGPVALCFGLLRPYKGIDALLEAWGQVRAPDAQLWIVGMPRMDVEALRATSPPSVKWVARYVAPAEAAAVFRRADVAVLPYREIDQSGVLFTALAFGKPLVISAVGGFPEVAAAGAAELVEPGDAGALAAAIERLLGDPGRRMALATAGRSLTAVGGPYGWDTIARRTLEVYAGLRRD